MCLGIPGKIVEVHDAVHMLAIADFNGVRRAVNITCIVDESHPPEACVDDWVLVHVGFAMSRIDEVEAARTLELLAQLGEVQAELDALRPSERAA